MVPIVTPDEMRAIDAAAAEPTDVLIGRAGRAVARQAVAMLGTTYGKRVAVIAGKGNNGADGRVAADLLRRRGVAVTMLDPLDPPWRLPVHDLVIDAAYGTGFRGTWSPPDVGETPVLAVDIPSGVDALTGAVAGDVLAATRTVTFAAYKPGLLIGPGAQLAGEVVVADIGLRADHVRAHLVTADDVAGWWPRRSYDSHKWSSALRIIAG
ncbi:MAG TPA: NAD(P)H-hydrate epimerase, partial [Ilumatobacteraceae bacterium]|nr:NAD(P)H-hydrate epimerase [Ilumatobacteraceae bacterium]